MARFAYGGPVANGVGGCEASMTRLNDSVRGVDKYGFLGSLTLAGLVSALLVSLVETMLIEIKYEILRGGFLQSHQLTSFAERLVFIMCVLAVNAALVLTSATIYRRFVAQQPGDHGVYVYNFLFLICIGATTILTIRYELLTYFSDALTFNLIREWGGGSLVNALSYVVEELSLVVVAVIGILVAYPLGRLLWRTSLLSHALAVGPCPSWSGFALRIGLVVALSGVALAAVNLMANVRPALQKSVGYIVLNGLWSQLTDFDRDSYSYFSQLTDHAPFDASRYPLALDVPNNGIDEDGYGGDLRLTELDLQRRPPSDAAAFVFPQRPPHLLLITLESARGALVGKRWHGRLVAPKLTDLAARGTNVTYAYSGQGFSVPSIKSLLTGHVYRHRQDESLFAILAAHGYRIALFSAGSESFGAVDQTTGMRAYSEIFQDATELREFRALPAAVDGSLRIDGRVLIERMEETILAEDWEEPRFLYVNFQEGHFPYSHPGMPMLLLDEPIPRSEISADNQEWLEATYWNAMANVDRHIGRLIELLEQKGVLRDMVVVVVGDHGESLFDDGFLGHGHKLNEVQTRIPLVFSVAGLNVEAPVSQAEVRDLILEVLGARYRAAEPAFDEPRPVFQNIGSLQRPYQVGIVEDGGRRTVLDTHSREIYFSDLDRWVEYEELGTMPDSDLVQRADRLVSEWGRLRWQEHLEPGS
jgi:phosphoglycerol transferase MdoB-like AlkP superfamily enzyme